MDAKAGDLIIGYESSPVKQVVAIAKVTRENDAENFYFEKIEGFATPIDYATLKSSSELERMEFFTNPQGSLFKLTTGEYNFIMDLIREENPVAQKDTLEFYSKEKFLEEVYSKTSLQNWIKLQNRIWQGIVTEGDRGGRLELLNYSQYLTSGPFKQLFFFLRIRILISLMLMVRFSCMGICYPLLYL